jgi:hypothetical protein
MAVDDHGVQPVECHVSVEIGSKFDEFPKKYFAWYIRSYCNCLCRTLGAVASAVVSLGEAALPLKLNPVVKPLMEAVRREETLILQREAALSLVRLMGLILGRTPCPNPKIVTNLVSFLCSR